MTKILPLKPPKVQKYPLIIVEMTKIPPETSKIAIICLKTLGTNPKLFKVTRKKLLNALLYISSFCNYARA